ncbi:MAG: hypothetical protein KDC09_10105 [Bacteroidales bacterium]|nr:hypothetical protein [Bacteroidales bacterium]
MRQIFKKSLKLFFILLLIGLLAAGGLFFVSEFYGDEIEQAVVEEVNQHLSVKINVDDIQFSVFENFPFASVTFFNVSSENSTGADNGPLIKAGEVSVLLNLYNIISKNYSIDKLLIRDGFVNLVVRKDGTRNFDIFNDTNPNSDAKFKLQLTQVIFKNIGISYLHYPSDQEYLFKISKGFLHGEFTTENQQIGFDGQVLTDYIRSGKTTLLKSKDLALQLQINQQDHGNKIIFQKAEIETAGMHFELAGSVDLTDKNRNLDLNIEAEPAPLKSFLNLVPDDFLEPLRDYQVEGLMDFKAAINGKFSGNNLPAVQFNFELGSGMISNPKNGFKAESLSLNGIFTNGLKRHTSSFDLKLNKIDGVIKGGQLKGNLQITNFNKPLVKADLIANLDLAEIKQYLNLSDLESISGKLFVDMSFTNQLQSFRQFTINDFISSRTAGSLKFEKLQFALKNNTLDYHDFDGSFQFSNKDLLIDHFQGKVSNSDFKMTGYFGNILAFTFIPGESVYISADFMSDKINLDELLAYSPESGDSPYQLTFSKNVNFDLEVNINHFTFRKFNGHNLQGKFSMAGQKFYVKEGSIQAMDGNVKMEGMINGMDAGLYRINCDADFTDVNIRQLFAEFGNFGQQNLTDEHLRGKATAHVQYKSTLTPSLYVDPASVSTYADVTIREGELIGYTPLYALSRYIKRDELEHVKFSTLKNNIKIENEVIHVPNMEINSSTMNITVFGTHTFDNITDYHFQLYLADLLKNGKKEKTEEEIEGIFVNEDESGKPRLFLSMTGPADDPDIKYDTREVRHKIAADLGKEKEEFKNVMRREFNWLSKSRNDSLSEENKTTGDQKQFAIGWDEVKKDSTIIKPQPKKQKEPAKKNQNSEKTFIVEWDETSDTIR